MPRNVGMRFSRGEYILFVDSDDAITSTALEELYPIAKKFDADVLYCEKHYPIKIGEKFTTDKNLLKAKNIFNREYNFVTKPKLVSYDITERIKDLVSFKFAVTPWNYFFRRDFLSKHDIHFPNWKYAEDNLFIFYALCWANTLIRIPNIFYIYRSRENSINTNKSLEIEIHRYADHVFQLMSTISKFAKNFPPLNSSPNILYAVFEWFFQRGFNYIVNIYAKIPAWQLEPLIKRELDKVEDKTPLTIFLFNRMNLLNLQVNQQNAILNQMNAYIQQQNQVLRQQQAKIEELQRQLSK